MNLKNKLLLIIVGLIASCIAAFSLYYRSLETKNKSENSRLGLIVEKEFENITIPTESVLVYQEITSDRVCKTARITKLFSVNVPTYDICQAIYAPLKAKGWKSPGGCRKLTYPFTKAPVNRNRPSYNHHRLVAISSKFSLTVTANPQNSWGQRHFDLSQLGNQDAVPLAKKNGETFFIVRIFYIEDRDVFEKHCPDNLEHCDCADTLFSWKFTNGRQFSRSW